MDLDLEIAKAEARTQMAELNEALDRWRDDHAQREAAGWVERSPPSEPVQAPAPRTRAVEPRQQPQRAGVDWDAVSKWVQAHIDGRVGTKTREFITEAAVGIGEEAGKLIAELRVQVDRQAARIEQLEQRLFQLAMRQSAAPPAPAAEAPAKPAPPRLIGVSDAAD